ncbi:MAG: hypothetical protein ABR987_12380 [Terracidiphilus sp.]|jgi:hypothetical protein
MSSPNPVSPNPYRAQQPPSQAPTPLQPRPRRTVKQVLLSYFYWTYSRGSFHYDVMVTVILLFIFLTPHIPGFSFGDKPSTPASLVHPISIVGDGEHGVIITVRVSDANVPMGASDAVVKKALRKAIEPVTGDAVFVEKWETVTDAEGNPAWRVWAHR